MEQWRKAIFAKFGKRARQKWILAVVDFQLMDLKIKPVCLFDHWAVSAQDMQTFAVELHELKLTHHLLCVLSIGLDVVIFNPISINFSHSSSLGSTCYVDVTCNLPTPTIVDHERVKLTLQIYRDFCDSVNHRSEDVSHDVYNVEIDEIINVPCLFGLLLGYPCVYWYDRTLGEEHCLSGCSLQLFQVKGQLCSTLVKETSPVFFSNKQISKSETHQVIHTIYSFTVPENLVDRLHDQVEQWFVAWKDSKCWSQIFSNVWLKEETVNPDAVCL